MPQCSVYCCNSNTSVKSSSRESIRFHRFPNREKSPVRYRAWLQRINRENFTPGTSSRVCSEHFEANDYQLSSKYKAQFLGTKQKQELRKGGGAIPTKNLKGKRKLVEKGKRKRECSSCIRKKLIAEAMDEVEATTVFEF